MVTVRLVATAAITVTAVIVPSRDPAAIGRHAPMRHRAGTASSMPHAAHRMCRA